MTIRKGETWGEATVAPADTVTVTGTAQLAPLLIDGPPQRPIGICGGDLGRTLGVSDRLLVPGAPATAVPLDLIRIDADGITCWASSHVVVRRRWLSGRIVAAMNAQYLGRWDVAPRSHPNDGRFDLVEVAEEMTIRDRLKARRRLPTGSHLPHPHLSTARMTSTTIPIDRGASVFVDGRPWTTRAGEVRLTLVPDAYTALLVRPAPDGGTGSAADRSS